MDTVLKVQHSHEELAANLASQGVEYVFGAFIDVCGRAKSKCVPVTHLPELLAGHERYTPRGLGGLGQMTPDEDECVALPDPSTLCVLPWDRRFAFMASDLYFGGTEPFALCPRSVLKRQVELAEAGGFAMQLGIETELYFYRPGATATAPPPGPIPPRATCSPTRRRASCGPLPHMTSRPPWTWSTCSTRWSRP